MGGGAARCIHSEGGGEQSQRRRGICESLLSSWAEKGGEGQGKRGGLGQDSLGRPVGHWEKTEVCSQGPAVPDIGLGSTPPNHSPASWETHRQVWSNVLAADHHPSQCQEAVA